MQSALATLDTDAVLAEIASGAFTGAIATRYGIGRTALRERLKNHPAYPEAIKAQAESLVESATIESMEVIAETAAIARARLRVDAAHKWAAARDPATWSGKVESTGTTINVQVVQFFASPQQSAPAAGAPAVASRQHSAHLDRLASLTPQQFSEMQTQAAAAIGRTRNGSPVAPPLVDSGVDKCFPKRSGNEPQKETL